MIEQVHNIFNLQGLSSDTPPYTIPATTGASAIPVPPGSTLHLIDTGDVLIYFNEGWMPDLRAARAFREALNMDNP
jgi:hypothetical protein